MFRELETHLIEVNNGNPLDSKLIDDFVDRVSIDRAVVLQNSDEIKPLLTAVINILHHESLDIDYDKVIEVLTTIVSQLDFEDVTSTLFSFDYLLEALKSNNLNLQILALKVATTAEPLDILANTEIIPIAIELLSNAETPVKLINEIELSMDKLIYSSLIRKRILSAHVLKDLNQMSKSNDVLVKTRLFDFVVKLIPFVQEHELPDSLYLFDDIYTDDIMYTLNIIKFYNELTDISKEILNKEWILVKIKPQLIIISELYFKRFEISDIEFFAVSAICQLFKSLSNASIELFKEIDLKYVHLNKKDELLLSILNPVYLSRQHFELLKNLPLTIDNVLVFRNLIKAEESFAIIKPNLSSNSLLKLPYLELVAILVVLTKYSYGSRFLLLENPAVMKKLLNGANVIETETYQLRKQTLENLNSLPIEDLDVWKNSIHREYSLLVNGSHNPGLANPLIL